MPTLRIGNKVDRQMPTQQKRNNVGRALPDNKYQKYTQYPWHTNTAPAQ